MIDSDRIREIAKIARPLNQNNFPMSLIVDKLGVLIAESFLTPFSSRHRIHKSRERQSPLSIVVVDPLIVHQAGLVEEYTSIYHQLKFDRESSNTLTKEARLEIYEAFVPGFQKFIDQKGAGTRGGDRKSKFAKERIAKQKSEIISLAEIQRVCDKLIPNAISYTEIQRDTAYLKASRSVRDRPSKDFSQTVQVHGYFNIKQYMKNIHHFKNDEIQVEILNLQRCISALQAEINTRKRPTTLILYLRGFKDKNSHSAELGLKLIRENLEKLTNPSVVNQVLHEFTEILNSGQWNAAFPAFLPNSDSTVTNLQHNLMELIYLILESAEARSIQIDKAVINKIRYSAKSIFEYSTPRMQNFCRKILSISGTILGNR